MKIGAVGGQLFHSDGQTDTTMLKVAFLNFANATEMTSVTKRCVSVRESSFCGHYWETGGLEMLAVIIGWLQKVYRITYDHNPSVGWRCFYCGIVG